MLRIMREHAPELEVVDVRGAADVTQVFPGGRRGGTGRGTGGRIEPDGAVAGCRVVRGDLRDRDDSLYYRVVRDGEVLFTGRVAPGGLRRFKEKVGVVEAGLECGVRLEGFEDLRVGDTLECVARFKRRLDIHADLESQLGEEVQA